MPELSLATAGILRRVSTATVATQLFKRGVRNAFLAGLGPLNPAAASFVGTAYTLRFIPAREDLDVVDVLRNRDHPQRVAIESVGPGQVLVMDCRGYTRTGSIGSILANRLAVRGAEAIVTDGSVRDSGELRQLAFPVYTAGVSAGISLSGHHAVDVQVPIGCAGVPIYPGDVLLGDRDGVICIPSELAESVADDAIAQEELESFILDRIKGGAAILEYYPPSVETVEAFERSRREAQADE